MSSAIIAELIGADTARAGEIICRGKSPVFALCRALLTAGADPDAPLHCYRASTLALRIRSIGEGAKLTIEESVTQGLRVRRWKPFSCGDVEPPMRSNEAAAPTHVPNPQEHAAAGLTGLAYPEIPNRAGQ